MSGLNTTGEEIVTPVGEIMAAAKKGAICRVW